MCEETGGCELTLVHMWYLNLQGCVFTCLGALLDALKNLESDAEDRIE